MAKSYYQKRQRRYKRMTTDIPHELYRRFRKSSIRRKAATDSEALRNVLDIVTKLDTESQQKNDAAVNPIA